MSCFVHYIELLLLLFLEKTHAKINIVCTKGALQK